MGIHLIMPMAGGGTRFGKEGYELPKPLIDLQGKPFFYWATQSVVPFVEVNDITFVVLQEHVNQFGIDQKILEFYPDAKIRVIPHLLNGAVLTCMEGVKSISDSAPVLFNDCDHAFTCKAFYDYCRQSAFDGLDGALLTFYSDSPNYSYVKFDLNGQVAGTIEKMVVSHEAICGAYYFKNRAVFEAAVQTYLNHCDYKEFFMSGVYNELCSTKSRVQTFPVDEHFSFGTPQEYEEAQKEISLKKLEL